MLLAVPCLASGPLAPATELLLAPASKAIILPTQLSSLSVTRGLINPGTSLVTPGMEATEALGRLGIRNIRAATPAQVHSAMQATPGRLVGIGPPSASMGPAARRHCNARQSADAAILARVQEMVKAPPSALATLDAQAALREIKAGLPAFPSREMEEVATHLVERSRRIARACKGDAKCIVRMSEGLGKEKWWRRWLKKSCMGRNPSAANAMMYMQAINMGGLIAAYMGERALAAQRGEEAEFPVGLAATWTIMELLWFEVGCIHENEKGGKGASAAKASFSKRMWNKYKAQLPLIPVEIGLVTGAGMVEDAWRGKGPMGWESAKRNFWRDGLFFLIYRPTIGAAKTAYALNPLYLEAFPWAKGLMARATTRGLTQAGLKQGTAKVAGAVPAEIAQFAGMWAVQSADNWVILWGRRWAEPKLRNGVNDAAGYELIPPPPEAASGGH
jgi:hypothetical protein